MGVVARILGKGESPSDLRAHVDNAKRALDEAQLAWGESGSADARDAFMRARDEHDRLTGRLLAAEKREREDRERVAREQTARDEAELSKLLARVGEIDAFAREVESAAVAEQQRRVELAARVHKRIEERERDIHRAQQLASKLGRELSIPTVTLNNVINGAKEALEHATHASKFDPRIAATAIELGVPRWFFRGERP